MKIAIPKERRADETRVAASPEVVGKLIGLGFQVIIEKGAGDGASFTDAAFREAGADIAKDARAALKPADMVFKIRAPLAAELPLFRKGAILIASSGRSSWPSVIPL